MDNLCYSFMLSRLFIAALWSPTMYWEKGDLLALVCDFWLCFFFTFKCDILEEVWYLIVSIPDLCHLS